MKLLLGLSLLILVVVSLPFALASLAVDTVALVLTYAITIVYSPLGIATKATGKRFKDLYQQE